MSPFDLLRCALPSFYLSRCALPYSYLLRCALPYSYLLRCALPYSYLLRCAFPSSCSCVVPSLLLFLRCALPSCCSCVVPCPRLIFCVPPCPRFIRCVASYPDLMSFVAPCGRFIPCVGPLPRVVLALCLSLLLFLALRVTLFFLRCVLPSSSCVALRCVLPYSCVSSFPSLEFRLSSFVCASCLSIVVALRVLFLIYFPVVVRFHLSLSYLLSYLPLSPFISSLISFHLLLYLSPCLSYPTSFSYLPSLRIGSYQDGFVVLPGGISRPGAVTQRSAEEGL